MLLAESQAASLSQWAANDQVFACKGLHEDALISPISVAFPNKKRSQ